MIVKTSKTLMTEGSISKKIIHFAFPIFLGSLFQQMYNTVDSLIVGNFLGSNALAAVSSSSNLIYLMISFFSGISMGAGVIIAKYYGAHDGENVERAVHTTVAFGLLSSFILTILGVIMAPQLLIWMDTPKAVMPDSVQYFRIYFMGSIGFVMYNTFVGILQSVGDSKHPLFYLITSSVINIILDIVFITIFHLGIGSAALATSISQVISALLCMIQLIRTKETYQLNLKKIRFNSKIFFMIIKIGLPSGIQNSIIGFANVVVQSSINSFGEIAMAGCGAYAKLEGFAFLPITSFTMALTTFVGQNLGAKQFDRVKKGARFGITCGVVLAEVLGVIIFVFAPVFIAAFDRNPEVIMYGVDRARVESLFFCLVSYSHTISAVLRGAGKSIVPMFVMLIFWCIVRVFIIAVVGRIVSAIEVVYWVYPITWGLSSIVFFIYYRKVDWMYGTEKK